MVDVLASPAPEAVVDRVSAMLRHARPGLTVEGWDAHEARSTFDAIVVRCASPSGDRLDLLCKIGTGASREHTAHGHRGGVRYEALVYEQVLARSSLRTPGCYGSFEIGDATVLVTELVVDAILLRDATVAAFAAAAAWIGAFHLETAHVDFSLPLARHDAGYQRGWAARAAEFAPERDRPWIGPLCRAAAEHLAEIAAAPAMPVVHGEYYPHNILVRDGAVLPVDWETAARGFGETDLVSLVDGWGPAIEASATEAYVAARWPAGAPDDLDERLDAARLAVLLRWLGDRREWTRHVRARPRIDRLRELGERMGLVQR